MEKTGPCPRCQHIKSWIIRRGKRRCAACRYEWVARALPLRLTPAEMVEGRGCAVLFFDPANPADAVVVAVWG
ncbi:MAG: hypothetical protein HY686_05585 [Chloroflexi bacterium]|nr:hypothetical protein [Chloroflexota bacterium]